MDRVICAACPLEARCWSSVWAEGGGEGDLENDPISMVHQCICCRELVLSIHAQDAEKRVVPEVCPRIRKGSPTRLCDSCNHEAHQLRESHPRAAERRQRAAALFEAIFKGEEETSRANAAYSKAALPTLTKAEESVAQEVIDLLLRFSTLAPHVRDTDGSRAARLVLDLGDWVSVLRDRHTSTGLTYHAIWLLLCDLPGIGRGLVALSEQDRNTLECDLYDLVAKLFPTSTTGEA